MRKLTHPRLGKSSLSCTFYSFYLYVLKFSWVAQVSRIKGLNRSSICFCWWAQRSQYSVGVIHCCGETGHRDDRRACLLHCGQEAVRQESDRNKTTFTQLPPPHSTWPPPVTLFSQLGLTSYSLPPPNNTVISLISLRISPSVLSDPSPSNCLH